MEGIEIEIKIGSVGEDGLGRRVSSIIEQTV